MARRNKSLNQLILWLVLFGTTALLILMFVIPKGNSSEIAVAVPSEQTSSDPFSQSSEQLLPPVQQSIDQLTRQDVVVDYLVMYQRLPDYYINKRVAQQSGWDARSGNLCDVLPGQAIGGDRFGNREGQLPNKKGRIWYEADINYRCGHRGADRLVYSNDGLIYVTTDHYKNFRQLRGRYE